MDTSHPQPSIQPKRPVPAIVGVIVIAILLILAFAIYVASTKAHDISPNSTTVKLVPAAVSITSNGFVPSTITIKKGQAVSWTNNDTAKHQIDSDPYPTNSNLSSLNDPQVLGQSDTYSYIFNKTGTYTYHDNLNPYSIKGVVIVK